jgi:hypothetical protein
MLPTLSVVNTDAFPAVTSSQFVFTAVGSDPELSANALQVLLE